MSFQLGSRFRSLAFLPLVLGACSQAQSPSGDAGTPGTLFRSSLSGASGLSGVSSVDDMSGHIAKVNAEQCDRMRQRMRQGLGAPDMRDQMARCDRLEHGADGPPARDPRAPLGR